LSDFVSLMLRASQQSCSPADELEHVPNRQHRGTELRYSAGVLALWRPDRELWSAPCHLRTRQVAASNANRLTNHPSPLSKIARGFANVRLKCWVVFGSQRKSDRQLALLWSHSK
jgi:hypothetical protein